MAMVSELERVVLAGAVSESFRRELLADPARAVEAGYLGEPFRLTPEERAFLAGIQARDFQEFAQKVSAWVSTQARRNGTSHKAWTPQVWGMQLVY